MEGDKKTSPPPGRSIKGRLMAASLGGVDSGYSSLAAVDEESPTRLANSGAAAEANASVEVSQPNAAGHTRSHTADQAQAAEGDANTSLRDDMDGLESLLRELEPASEPAPEPVPPNESVEVSAPAADPAAVSPLDSSDPAPAAALPPSFELGERVRIKKTGSSQYNKIGLVTDTNWNGRIKIEMELDRCACERAEPATSQLLPLLSLFRATFGRVFWAALSLIFPAGDAIVR